MSSTGSLALEVPAWMGELDDAHGGGEHVILRRNVDDWVLANDGGPPVRLVEAVAAMMADRGYTTISYSLGCGAASVLPPGRCFPARLRVPEGRSPEEVLPALTAALRDPRTPLVVVIDHVEGLAPASGPAGALARDQQVALEVLHGWGMDAAIRAAGNMVVLVSRQDQVHELLRSGSCGFRTVSVPLPDLPARQRALHLVARLVGEGRTDLSDVEPGTSRERVAAASAGMRVDDLLRLSRHAASGRTTVSLREVLRRKRATVTELADDLLEIRDPINPQDQVSGLHNLRHYLARCVAADVFPTGLLFVGPPGVGKSLGAELVAASIGLPLVSARLVRDQWVGSSERRLERMFWLLETLAPCVVRLDEIDQIMPKRADSSSTDSGVNSRLFGRFLEFMGETIRGREILWIGTSNTPDLDVAMVDRVGFAVPFLHPTPSEIVALLPALAAQLKLDLSPDVGTREVEAIFRGRLTTARALVNVLRQARLWTTAGDPIGAAALMAAAQDARPNIDPRVHELIALRAIAMTSATSLYSWMAPGAPSDARDLPYLAGVVNEDGSVDEEYLGRRIAALTGVLSSR